MADANTLAGLAAASLGPAALVLWLVRRWVRRVVRTLLVVALVGAALLLGGGDWLGRLLPDPVVAAE